MFNRGVECLIVSSAITSYHISSYNTSCHILSYALSQPPLILSHPPPSPLPSPFPPSLFLLSVPGSVGPRLLHRGQQQHRATTPTHILRLLHTARYVLFTTQQPIPTCTLTPSLHTPPSCIHIRPSSHNRSYVYSI